MPIMRRMSGGAHNENGLHRCKPLWFSRLGSTSRDCAMQHIAG